MNGALLPLHTRYQHHTLMQATALVMYPHEPLVLESVCWSILKLSWWHETFCCYIYYGRKGYEQDLSCSIFYHSNLKYEHVYLQVCCVKNNRGFLTCIFS